MSHINVAPNGAQSGLDAVSTNISRLRRSSTYRQMDFFQSNSVLVHRMAESQVPAYFLE